MARNPYIGVDPQTGDMMIRPLVQPVITPAPTYNANAVPSSPSRGVAPQQPVSPVAGLTQTAQAGLEGAERISKQVAKSPKVQGLLGGGESASGLLSDIQGDAALQGLFATMQAIGRPVQRGEDRYLGAVQYGQGVMQQAQKQGLGDLTARMQLDKYQMERDALQRKQDTEQKLLEAWSNVNATGGTAVNAASMFGEDLTDQMSDAQKRAADQAARLQARALQLSTLGPQYADATKDLLDQSKVFADQATVGLLTPEKKTNLILSESKTFRKEVYEPKAEIVNARNDIVRLVESNQPASAFLSIVKLVKTAEPDSAVQQGEFETIAGFNSFLDSVIEFAQLRGEGSMPQDMKDKLVRTADALAKGAVQDYSREASIATERYDALKLDSSQIVPEIPPLIDYSYGGQSQNPSDVANRARSIRGGRTGAGR
jgi:hypothetical protein